MSCCDQSTAVAPRAYTYAEILRMRTALRNLHYCMANSPFGYNADELNKQVEDKLRTYILASTSVEDVETSCQEALTAYEKAVMKRKEEARLRLEAYNAREVERRRLKAEEEQAWAQVEAERKSELERRKKARSNKPWMFWK